MEISAKRWIAPAALLTFFFGLLFSWSMDRGLNHDEHQFLVPGALLSREGLLPYRDYPLFHLPNLTFLYAALDWLTGRPILSAKLLSVASAFSAGVLLVLQCYRTLSRSCFLVAALALGFLFFDPLFAYTTGKTWNHDFPTALALFATVLVVQTASAQTKSLSVLAGLCAGLAVGSRLTFAPILLPLWAAHLTFQAPFRQRWSLSLAFFFGSLLGLLPSLSCLRMAPDAFLFDNFEFPRLRLLDPENLRIQKTMTWWRKLRYFAKEVVVPSWPLFVAAFSLALAPTINWFRTRSPQSFPVALVMTTLPFLLLGCFAPSRYQYQHYFVLIPFLVLAAIYGAAANEAAWTPRRRWLIALLFASSLASYSYTTFIKKGGAGFDWLVETFQPENWMASRTRAESAQLRLSIGPGRILTLAPTWVLEAGLPIYPQFATGPFAWRSASLLPEPRRRQLHLVAPEDLERLLTKEPPAGILTGVEDAALEEPLVNYAKAHELRPLRLGKKRILWVPIQR